MASPPRGETIVQAGVGDGGTIVVLDVWQELMVTVPDPAEREIARETVDSSDLSILRLLPGGSSGRAPTSVLRVPFLALRAEIASITAGGSVPFAFQVEVVTP